MRTNWLAVVLGVAAISPATGNSEEGALSQWRCTSGELEREIALYQRDDTLRSDSTEKHEILACRVVYTKDGGVETLWQARNDPGFCQPRVTALIAKLETAGFRCEQTTQSASAAQNDAEVVAEEPPPPGASEASRSVEPSRSVEQKSALSAVLERHYEDSYLDAMLDAVPVGFVPLPDSDVLAAGNGTLLHIGPPDHFVKTLADGSYVLVNTLLLEQPGTASFVNFGFLVRDKRYRFLGYATVLSVSAAKVENADSTQVSMMVSTALPPSCEVSRRVQTLSWSTMLDLSGPGESGVTPAGSCKN